MKFNIVLKSLRTSLAIVLVVILASCAKQLPKPSKDVKSVLVIPVKVLNKARIKRQYDYVLNFQGKPTSGSWQGGNSPKNDQLFSAKGNLKQDGNSLTIISGLPPGEHRLFSMTENPINVENKNPNTKRMRKHLPFTLEEGKLSIYPNILRYSQWRPKGDLSNSFTSSKNFGPLTDQELTNINEELKQYKNYELWALQDKKADGTLTEEVTSTESNKIPEKFTSGLELDVGVNSKYKLSSNVTWLSNLGSDEVDLEGSDIRFVYIADHGIHGVSA